jgi:polar amino acid transport system substrate-binding protein
MNISRLWIALIAPMLAVHGALADDVAARRDLAPTGRLRVAIAVSPAPSALYAIRDASSGAFRGVAVDLGTALARKLGVPVEFVPYLASGEIVAAAGTGVWDVSFMPVDDERRKIVDFGAPYHLLQSTYLVAPGSAIQTLAEANRAGVRIAGVAGTATFRASNRTAPNATHVTVAGVDAAIELMRSGGADAIALSRESLGGLAARISGSRVLDGGFLNSTTAVAVPKNKPAALAYASEFIESAKASGAVRRAFDNIGLASSVVAPAGMKP